ncbi:MAG: FGGY-family carbohydrate kinase, partial [Ruthenibacterium sp.]
AIIGFSDIHTRIHIYRAIIEGINFALMDGLQTMEKRGNVHIKELYVAGGGAQSAEICQITADMFGLPVHRIQTHEASGLGSSMVTFVAKGIFPDIHAAAQSMVHIKNTFLPDKAVHAVYENIYREIFQKIFSRLLPLYKKSSEMDAKAKETPQSKGEQKHVTSV